MKTVFVLLLTVAAVAAAQEVDPPRDSMNFFFGAGVWMPGLMNDDNQIEVGPVFAVGAETPMSQGNQFRFSAGYGRCSSGNAHFDGITSVMLNIAYREYPFYRPYAGARGLEPFYGFSAGGIVGWDSVADDFSDTEESTSTGGAIVGVHAGARLKVNENTFFDITIGGDWVPIGGNLAGETEKDLSGLKIQGSLVF
jgi:hypothetical protein